jgi:GH15 family glucan-1,4-alpha-glucosidase
LETDHFCETGVARVIDFMPSLERRGAIIRVIQGIAGTVPMRMELSPRGNYGAVPPWFERERDSFVGRVGECRFIADGTINMESEPGMLTAEFDIAEGETRYVTLRYMDAEAMSQPEPVEALQALADTERSWRGWIGRFDKATDWPDAVRRSLITLKALIYAPSGGMVAAVTTSLPEAPGGKLNWDYRFSWIRDASFALCAWANAGFCDEAQAWRDWLLRTVGADPGKMRIMYRVTGERHIPESEIDWLVGYNHAMPVRIGNAASTQHQADIFGELLEAMHVAAQAGIARTPHSIEIETEIVEHIEESWRKPGAGLWESRAEPRHFVYSRVMAWAGVDRFLKAPENCAYAGPERVARWQALRATIHADICYNGFHPGLDRFVEYYGGQTIDACLLLLPLVNFLPVGDARIAATIAAIERELVEDGLVRRKVAHGGETQGAFIACTLWLADCQNMQGRHAQARKTFEHVLAVRNDLGLLSEEYNVPGKHLAGNFPQALSHLALVNTALGLCGPVLQRGGG